MSGIKHKIIKASHFNKHHWFFYLCHRPCKHRSNIHLDPDNLHTPPTAVLFVTQAIACAAPFLSGFQYQNSSNFTVYFLAFHPLVSQEYIANVQHFGVEQGLSHRDVYCTFQDSRGFIWMGTKYGLNRFDGHGFKIFTKEKHGLADNEINHILEDAAGWLWVFKGHHTYQEWNFSEVSLVNIYTGKVMTLEERFGADIPFRPGQVFSAIQNVGGTVFLGTKDGRLIRFHPSYGFKVTDIENGHLIHLMYITQEGNIIIENAITLSRREILEMDTFGNQLWSYEKGNQFAILFQDKAGTKWFNKIDVHHDVNTPELHVLNQDRHLQPYKTVFDFPKEEGQFSKIWYRSIDDTFWYKYKNRFLVFHPNKGTLFGFEKDFPEIANNEVNDIFFDHWNNAWVATAFGIYKIQLKPSPFKKHLSQPKESYNINTAFSARGMALQNGQLWVNSVQPLQYQIDLNTSEAVPLKAFKMFTVDGADSYKNIFRPVIPIGEGELLFAGRDHLLFHPVDQSYEVVPWKKDANTISFTWSLFLDSHKNKWTGLHQYGLAIQEDSIVPYTRYNEFTALQKSSVYTFLEYDHEHLLIGSTSGIYVLHQQKGIINRFWPGGNNEQYFPHDHIYHLQKDNKNANVVWAATGGGGLVRTTVNQQAAITSFQQFTVADGLSNNVIYAAYDDGNGNLWLPSDYGIIRFNKSTFACKAYLERDGISHNEFNRTSHLQGKDGILYFGGLNGITAFHPDDISNEKETFEAPLEILNFQQYDGAENKLVDKTNELLDNMAITLRPGDRLFNLEFALLEYQDFTQVRYAYKIDGQDEDWIYLKDNILRISGLPYGTFTLRVKGQGASGQFSVRELEIPIRVSKPFYLRTWFLASAVFIFFFSLFIFYKWWTLNIVLS